MTTGTLYVVSTPIGNLEDITLRALRILREVDIIACEDTRHTKILTAKYGISTQLISYFQYKRRRKGEFIIKKLKEGKNIALVSDAGTPGISDPGTYVIKLAIQNNIPVVAIPGPTALIAALVISGKATHKFVFEGFLSSRPSQRRKRLEALSKEERTVIIYESPHRIRKMLSEILQIFGDIELVLVREITKKFEEVKRQRVSLLLQHFSNTPPRGEFIVII